MGRWLALPVIALVVVAPRDATSAAPAPRDATSPVVASRAGSAAARSVDDAACGDAGGPCTMQAWMKANSAPAMRAGDLDALHDVLEHVATLAPAGYPNWASIARDGARAAQAQDLEAVKAACRSCHAQYKDRYRRERHDRAI